MSNSIAGVQVKPGTGPARKPSLAVFILIRLFQRIFFAIILIFGIIFFVGLVFNMSASGGYTGFFDALTPAMDDTLLFIQDAFSGQLETLEELGRAFPKSLGLLATAIFLGAASGILLGGLAARFRNNRLSTLIINASIIGISTPSYVAAMFLIWTVVWIYQQTGVRILPIYGFGWDLRMVMPMIVLATRPMANITRLTYTALKDIYEADYVRTAYGKGLRPRSVFIYHVLKNAGIPILTIASVSFRFSLSMLPIVETIFSWLGIGFVLIEAAQQRDYLMVVTMTIPLVLLYLLITILLDFLYPLIDPRVVNAVGAE